MFFFLDVLGSGAFFGDCVLETVRHQKLRNATPKTTTATTSTLPETNIAPENGWLEYKFPFGVVYFQGLYVKLAGCMSL